MMFSFLAPSLLWLAPLLTVPLVLHFMGRAQPKVRDFPSLLPVRESLQRAMRRHRLKNWLQLVLRTLAILCLLLAAAGPVWRTNSALNPPTVAGLLLHNGAYATLPDASPFPIAGGRDARNTFRNTQEAMHVSLDSLTSGGTHAESVLLETEGRASARFGRPAEAVARLVRAADEHPASLGVHLFVPVFAARDLAALANTARPWLEAHPAGRLILIDYGDAGDHLRAFGPVQSLFEKEGMLTLQAPTPSHASAVWVSGNPTDGNDGGNGGGDMRPAPVKDGLATVTLPLPNAGWITGSFTLQETGTHSSESSEATTAAFLSTAAAFRVPPPATLCHVGSAEAFTSLATLGAGGERLRIRSFSTSDGALNWRRGPGMDECNLLYLADPLHVDATLLARAAAVARVGGKVILEAGRNTDVVLWNRNLLMPLGVGRLTSVNTTQGASAFTPVAVRAEALSRLGAQGDAARRWGKPGTVRTRIGFIPAAGTTVILTAAGPEDDPEQGAVLIHHRIGSGELLLWTTSLSDPAWSDIGLGPWAALAHQAFLERTWARGVENRATDADSLLFLSAPEDAEVQVTDPEGNPFVRLRAEPGGWIAGPFDRPGLYKVVTRGEAAPAWFAVNPANPPAVPTSEDWESFHGAMGARAWSQTVRLKAGKDWRELYGGFRLRLGLLVLTALLLFAEGLASLRLKHASNTF